MSARSDRNKEQTPPPLLLMPPGGGLTMEATSGVNLLVPIVQNNQSLITADMEAEADSFIGQTPPDSANTSASEPATFTYFQTQSQQSNDPFAQVGYKAHPVSSQNQPIASQQVRPPASATPPQIPNMAGQPPISGFGQPPASATPPPAEVTPHTMMTQPFYSAASNGDPPVSGAPSMGGPPPMAGPPSGPPLSFRRQQGPPRYAPPPVGTYANSGPAPPMMTPISGPHPPINAPPPPMSGPTPPAMSGPPPMSVPPLSGPPPSQTALPPNSMFVPDNPPAYSEFSDQSAVAPQPEIYAPTSAMAGLNQSQYRPVQHHWFYRKEVEGRDVWRAFSVIDSMKLEEAWCAMRIGREVDVVATDGGRYDVDLQSRTRTAIYWIEEDTEVRRCSWFYKQESDGRFVPYTEDFASKLEEEYRNAILTQVWHKRLEFPGGETIVMHNPKVIVHFRPSAMPDEFGTTAADQYRPMVVRRGIGEFDNIEDGEPSQVDHLVFVVHGIGPICDMRFRSIVECVDDFRSISIQLMNSHFKPYLEEGRVGRVEFLPVYWYDSLHGDATGVDRQLKSITLRSIPKLRHFTNNTLLDILFYSSPRYCQQIAQTVGSEINRLYSVFLERNPSFRGQVSLTGHSLGSLIVFDLLSHQTEAGTRQEVTPDPTPEEPDTAAQQEGPEEVQPLDADMAENTSAEDTSLEALLERLSLTNFLDVFQKEQVDLETLKLCNESDIKEMGLPMGPRKKILTYVKEEQQREEEAKRHLEWKAKMEEEKKIREEAERELKSQMAANSQCGLLTHVLEPLMTSASSTEIPFIQNATGAGQLLVRYPKLDFSIANFFALGSPIAMFCTVRGINRIQEDYKLPTCEGVFNIFHPFDPVAYRIEPLINPDIQNRAVLMPHHKGRKRLHLELKDSLTRMGTDLKQRIIESVKSTWNTIHAFAQAHRQPAQEEVESEVDSVIKEMTDKQAEQAETESVMSENEDLHLGVLNQGRRIDYVLQEKPIESFNDYIFALGSHACYWESEDTVLFILKETYALLGIAPIQQGMTESPRAKFTGPPPMSGFRHGPPPPSSTNAQQLSFNTGPPPLSAQAPAMMRQAPPPMSGAPPTMSHSQASDSMEPPSGPPPLHGFVRR